MLPRLACDSGYRTSVARYLAFVSCFVAALILDTACGPGGQVDPLNLETWTTGSPWGDAGGEDAATGNGASTAENGGAGDYNGTSVNTPAQPNWANGETLLAGEVATNEPTIELDTDHLDFGAYSTLLLLRLRNSGPGTLEYTIHTDVTWATASPDAGSNSGSYDEIQVRVDRSGLSSGRYTGQLFVEAGAQQRATVDLHMTVGESILAISTTLLDFGATAHVRAFTLRNEGAGILKYTIQASVDWLTIEPAQGELAGEIDTIKVQVSRGPLVVGRHQALLTVLGDGGQKVEVVAVVEKRPTQPLIMPWLELNYPSPAEIDSCVDALKRFHRVTDIAIVSTMPGKAFIYTELRKRVPGMRIIPGLKTCERLGTGPFDSLSGWRLIGDDVRELVAASGATLVIMENEDAIMSYVNGSYQIDFQRLRQCLRYLPSDVQYIWYPLHMHNELVRSRTLPIIYALQDVLNVRLVDHSYGHPDWHNEVHRRVLREVAENPVIIMLWWGCFESISTCYWDYDRVADVLSLFKNEKELIFYPADANRLAQAVVNSLSP